MNNFITKLWIFLLVSIVVALGIFVSVFFLIAVLFILMITIPYVYYLKWKAKKEFEKYYNYETRTRKMLEEKFKEE